MSFAINVDVRIMCMFLTLVVLVATYDYLVRLRR